ncbi:alpha/beta hydrolase family protein [Microbacterium sp. ASV81]|uniref:Alpha/beta fold hydrolase n=1 Tax=Microbacterium capsulatum TaxID=3041921 RepID=A0ABU0XD51_9MICO|nr:alpha/beta fold hydrolase [Microbacterium sp. ASV81]MDQ4213039.1 alpha/beta fold hydrolase [Microbacterium sp. ASV81]
MTHSVEATWTLDGIDIFGTITKPTGDGPFPAVVLVAGSGPTDRDWNSPLLPGTNGSGRLLAEELAENGFASMRYDKRASGPHVMQNLPRLSGTFSMASHLAELGAAVDALVADPAIDRTRVVGLGNSEGCLHVLHYAVTGAAVGAVGLAVPFAGAVLTGPPGRSVGQVLDMQLAAAAAAMPDGERILVLVREAMARFSGGGAMDPDPAIPDDVANVLRSFDAPANLPFARELWAESAADDLARVAIPTLVLIGGKDLQIDATADGDPLRVAAAGNVHVSFAFPPDANHVLKHEPRPRVEIVPGSNYNEDGAQLDPGAVATIVDWLRQILVV